MSPQERQAYARKLRKIIARARRRPCTDCGNYYVQQNGNPMTFDHLPGWQKRFDIGAVSFWFIVPVEDLLLEIRKCEVVCRECHDERERRRRDEARAARRREAKARAIAACFDQLAALSRAAIKKEPTALGRALELLVEAAPLPLRRRFRARWAMGHAFELLATLSRWKPVRKRRPRITPASAGRWSLALLAVVAAAAAQAAGQPPRPKLRPSVFERFFAA